jgi:ABC-type glycerol-3-phosphate transport system substrate-binding protein
MAFVRHMTSDNVQRRIVHDLRMLPARRSIQQDPLFETDPTLQAAAALTLRIPTDRRRRGT